MLKFLQFKRRNDGFSGWHLLVFFTLIAAFVYRMCWLIWRLRVLGRTNVPVSGPFIIVCNHQSHLDPMVVGAALRDRAPRALARASLMENNGLAGWLIGYGFGSIPVDRSGEDPGGMRRLLLELKAGRGVVIYPEGQRYADGKVHPFKRGVWLLIKRGGVPVIPAGVSGMGDIWAPGTSRPKLRGRMGLAFGTPIEHAALKAMGEQDAMDTLHAAVTEQVKAATWWT